MKLIHGWFILAWFVIYVNCEAADETSKNQVRKNGENLADYMLGYGAIPKETLTGKTKEFLCATEQSHG